MSVYQRVKTKVYGLLNPGAVGDRYWDKVINGFIIILIILNVVAVMLETVKPISDQYKTFFYYFDLVSVIIFSVEYLLRLWSINVDPRYRNHVGGRLKYMVSPAALIDLIAIFPFFIYLIFDSGIDLREVLLLRFFRVLRIFRLTAYTKSATIIGNVFKRRYKELLLSLVLASFLIVITACLVFFAENRHPVSKENFSSIPATLWWAVVTLTTTGYGDIVPMTTLGKSLTSLLILAGVAFFALPAGILSAGFQEEFRRKRLMDTHRCPHCGELLEWDESGHAHD